MYTHVNTANQNNENLNIVYLRYNIQPSHNVPHILSYITLIVLATVFSMTWYKIANIHSLRAQHGISHLSLVLS